MDYAKRQKLVSKIVSGVTYIEYNETPYIIREPSPIDKLIAERVYEEKFTEAKCMGIQTEKVMIEAMINLGLWSKKEEKEMESIPKETEQCKVDLYNAYVAFKDRDPPRKKLQKLNLRLTRLMIKKNMFRKQTAEGIGEDSKNACLICCNVTDYHGNKIWKHNEYLKQDGVLHKFIIDMYIREQIAEKEIRELCKNDPWRTLWGVGKSESSIFGKPAVDLSQEQRAIIAWSRVYDNIYENPECPPDEVIKDDDMLDGWLTLQGRQREQNKSAKSSQTSTNSKGDEVYYFADSQGDAQRIFEMNDNQGRALLRNREKEIVKSDSPLAEEKTFEAKMEMLRMAKENFKAVQS